MAGRTLTRDRAIVLVALLAVIAMAWTWLAFGVCMPERMDGAMRMMAPAWTSAYAAAIFAMWAGMMVAMMLPAATPTILIVAAVMRERGRRRVFSATGLFVTGYVLAWVAFSVLATATQWELSRIGLLSSAMASNSTTLAGAMLVVTGAYQWTRFKQACLVRCRSPVEPLTRYWRRGAAGPLLAGLRIGVWCLGCCGLLMALLFVGGVMNLAWIALLALIVLIEKTVPQPMVSRVLGVALIAGGAWTLFA